MSPGRWEKIVYRITLLSHSTVVVLRIEPVTEDFLLGSKLFKQSLNMFTSSLSSTPCQQDAHKIIDFIIKLTSQNAIITVKY